MSTDSSRPYTCNTTTIYIRFTSLPPNIPPVAPYLLIALMIFYDAGTYVIGVKLDNGRGLDCKFDLLIALTHSPKLHLTDHCFTH
jgi:hypothetical protein